MELSDLTGGDREEEMLSLYPEPRQRLGRASPVLLVEASPAGGRAGTVICASSEVLVGTVVVCHPEEHPRKLAWKIDWNCQSAQFFMALLLRLDASMRSPPEFDPPRLLPSHRCTAARV